MNEKPDYEKLWKELRKKTKKRWLSGGPEAACQSTMHDNYVRRLTAKEFTVMMDRLEAEAKGEK